MKFNQVNFESTDKDGESYKTRFIPVTKWNDYHPWPSVSGLRFMIFNAHLTGFEKCVLRIGRRVLIDEERFFEWARNQNEENK